LQVCRQTGHIPRFSGARGSVFPFDFSPPPALEQNLPPAVVSGNNLKFFFSIVEIMSPFCWWLSFPRCESLWAFFFLCEWASLSFYLTHLRLVCIMSFGVLFFFLCSSASRRVKFVTGECCCLVIRLCPEDLCKNKNPPPSNLVCVFCSGRVLSLRPVFFALVCAFSAVNTCPPCLSLTPP